MCIHKYGCISTHMCAPMHMPFQTLRNICKYNTYIYIIDIRCVYVYTYVYMYTCTHIYTCTMRRWTSPSPSSTMRVSTSPALRAGPSALPSAPPCSHPPGLPPSGWSVECHSYAHKHVHVYVYVHILLVGSSQVDRYINRRIAG